MSKKTVLKCLNLFAMACACIALVVGVYIAYQYPGVDGGFGPGSYYYTDIPNWEKIFLGPNSANIGFQHPLLAVIFFVGWGYLCFRIASWLDRIWK